MEQITSNRAKQSTREPDDRTVTPGISSDILSRQTSSLRKSYDDYPLRGNGKVPAQLEQTVDPFHRGREPRLIHYWGREEALGIPGVIDCLRCQHCQTTKSYLSSQLDHFGC
jgi:hypothetical protein